MSDTVFRNVETNKITNPTIISTSDTIQPNKSIVIDDPEKKKENPVKYYVKFSFVITYILLLTTATITFIEAIRTKTPFVRHVLNLETCISVVAGYFYSVFVSQIENFSNKGIEIDWGDISKTRYIDWSITTPMMLLALCLVLAQNANKSVKLSVISTVVILNYIMLYTGYAGENNMMPKYQSQIIGFIPFILMFAIIFFQYVKPSGVTANYVLYAIYLIVWTMYGFVYMFGEEFKNISMNILDCTAKCLIGLSLWAYYTKIIVV
jgi:bacteriorhodopsin